MFVKCRECAFFELKDLKSRFDNKTNKVIIMGRRGNCRLNPEHIMVNGNHGCGQGSPKIGGPEPLALEDRTRGGVTEKAESEEDPEAEPVWMAQSPWLSFATETLYGHETDAAKYIYRRPIKGAMSAVEAIQDPEYRKRLRLNMIDSLFKPTMVLASGAPKGKNWMVPLPKTELPEVKWRALDEPIEPFKPAANFPTPGKIYFGKILVEEAAVETSSGGQDVIVKGRVIP